MVLESFAADLPQSLAWADDLLTRYGRWAVARRRGGRTCGSLEGNYRAPAWDDDERRAPQALALGSVDALAVNRALQEVPAANRVVLRILYVPDRLPIAAQLRMQRIPPALCQVRHLDGVRMFANLYKRNEGGH